MISTLPAELITDRTLRLRDGRALGLSETGSQNGPAIFHFHGHRSSRLEIGLLAETATRLGIRLIGFDRPGIGRSDPKPGFRILDWPDDVQDAAGQLGIDRFAVEGFSAGGIYALACAYKIPHRLSACGLIASGVPGDLILNFGPRWMRTIWWLGRHAPWIFLPGFLWLARAKGATQENVEAWLVRASSWLAGPDQKVLADPEIRAVLAKTLMENARQSRPSNPKEALTDFRPWGFAPENIAFKTIRMWHGEQDRLVPVDLARRLARALPQCAATFYPDEGHISVLANHAQDILARLSQPETTPATDAKLRI